MESSSVIDQIASALVDAQGEFEAVSRTATNPFFNSHYAPLPKVVQSAAPILLKYGLAVIQAPDVKDGEDVLVTRLTHVSGQWIEGAQRLHLTKGDPQAHASAITYARRYGYMSILGLVADDDDDGNAASVATSSDTPRITSGDGTPPTTAQLKFLHARAAAKTISEHELNELSVRVTGGPVSTLTKGSASRLIDVVKDA